MVSPYCRSNAPTTLQGVRTLLWCGRLKLHKTGNEVRHVGNCRSCQKQIFAPFSEERRFRILNVLFESEISREMQRG